MNNDRVNIGELDTLVTVWSVVIERGDRGQKIYVPTEHSKVFARIEQNSDESVTNTNLESVQSATATIYKIHGLTTRWQLSIREVKYSIEAINPISRISPFCELSIRRIEAK